MLSPNGHPWNASTIHGNRLRGTGIVNNEAYAGRLVWNRQRFVKDPTTGRRVGRINSPSEWIIQPVPELHIVSEELWNAVRARQRQISSGAPRSNSNPLNTTHRRRYLLSGLLRCAVCGSSYTIIGHDRYACAGYRERGTCENRRAIKRAEIESRVLEGLKERLVAPELVEDFIGTVRSELNRRNRELTATYESSRHELTETNRKIASILAAIEDGIYTVSTRRRLLDLEQRKAVLERQSPAPPPPTLHRRLADIYREKVAHLRESLNDPEIRDEAADILRSLIQEIRLLPIEDERELEATLYGDLGGILAVCGAGTTGGERARIPVVSMVAGEGFKPPTLGL